MGVTRREMLVAAAASGAGLVIAGAARVAEARAGDAGAGAAGAAPRAQEALRMPAMHAGKLLPFDPAKLTGLSEKLLKSHHQKNYMGAVDNLNKVEAQLAQVGKDTPAFVIAGLRERELTFRNSKALHELYFGNLGGDGKTGGDVAQSLGGAYGSAARWEELFRATAMGLAGGSGWVVLSWSFAESGLVIAAAGGHKEALPFAAPLLVLDMFEHAYQMDHGAAAGAYVDAFFANLRWEAVEQRFQAARKADALLRT